MKQVKTIDILNPDCLGKIFLHLQPDEKNKVNKVCKKWSFANKFAWNKIKTLNSCDRKLFQYFVSNEISQFDVNEMLKRCGESLEVLTLTNNCDSTIMTAVSKHCVNLKKLVLILKDYHPDNFKTAFSKMTKLESIDIKKLDDTWFKNIASHDNVFQSVTSNIKEISLNANYDKWLFFTDNFTSTLGRFDELVSIKLEKCHLDNNMMNILLQKKSIKQLSLISCKFDPEKFYTMNLINLEYLNLSFSININDILITSASRNCERLKYLNLSSCMSLSKNALLNIRNFENIEELYINNLDNIDDNVLYDFRSLKILECEGCKDITDVGIMRVVLQNYKKLERLGLGKSGITDETISCVNDVTKRRDPKFNLYITASEDVVNSYYKVNDTSEYLIIKKLIDY